MAFEHRAANILALDTPMVMANCLRVFAPTDTMGLGSEKNPIPSISHVTVSYPPEQKLLGTSDITDAFSKKKVRTLMRDSSCL